MDDTSWAVLARCVQSFARAPLREALHELADWLVPDELSGMAVVGFGPAGFAIPVLERYDNRSVGSRTLAMQWAEQVSQRVRETFEPVRLIADDLPFVAVATPLRHGDQLTGMMVVVAPRDSEFALLRTPLLTEVAGIIAERLALEATWLPRTSTTDVPGSAARPVQVERKDAFLAAMSHELRTPLNSILGLTESLHEGVYGSLSTTQDAAVQDIESSGRLLLSLINDLLDLSKIEAGKLDIDAGPVDLGQTVRAVCHMLSGQADRAGVTLVLKGEEDMPAVHADSRLLLQMISNLVGNAIKFTPSGGKVVITWRTAADAAEAQLRVTDNGPGIAPADQERVFEPFVQLPQGGRHSRGGSGLGLALVLSMAEHTGARVTLESQVGVGSTFGLQLPFSSAW